jgi:hypothetical protein
MIMHESRDGGRNGWLRACFDAYFTYIIVTGVLGLATLIVELIFRNASNR